MHPSQNFLHYPNDGHANLDVHDDRLRINGLVISMDKLCVCLRTYNAI